MSSCCIWDQENLCLFNDERKFELEKTEDPKKIYFLKFQYGLGLSENSKVVYGRTSTKWTSWKGKDILVKKD